MLVSIRVESKALTPSDNPLGSTGRYNCEEEMAPNRELMAPTKLFKTVISGSIPRIARQECRWTPRKMGIRCFEMQSQERSGADVHAYQRAIKSSKPFVCADEGAPCVCIGKVYMGYGRKWSQKFAEKWLQKNPKGRPHDSNPCRDKNVRHLWRHTHNPNHGDICTSDSGAAKIGSSGGRYFCPHGCVAIAGAKAPYCGHLRAKGDKRKGLAPCRAESPNTLAPYQFSTGFTSVNGAAPTVMCERRNWGVNFGAWTQQQKACTCVPEQGTSRFERPVDTNGGVEGVMRWKSAVLDDVEVEAKAAGKMECVAFDYRSCDDGFAMHRVRDNRVCDTDLPGLKLLKAGPMSKKACALLCKKTSGCGKGSMVRHDHPAC